MHSDAGNLRPADRPAIGHPAKGTAIEWAYFRRDSDYLCGEYGAYGMSLWPGKCTFTKRQELEVVTYIPNNIVMVSTEDASPYFAGDVPGLSRTRAFWPLLRFVKETHVWLVWVPLLVIGLGIGMNFLAVKMNHGTMPVVVPPSEMITKDKMHVAATANSRVLLLCDWIQLYAIGALASPGDFLISAGEFLKWPLVWMWIGLNGARLRCRWLIAYSGMLS